MCLNVFLCKKSLYKESTFSRLKYLEELILLEDNMNLNLSCQFEKFYSCKQSKNGKLCLFICSQSSHRDVYRASFLPWSGKIQGIDAFLCLCHSYGIKNALKIKELFVREFLLLQFDH